MYADGPQIKYCLTCTTRKKGWWEPIPAYWCIIYLNKRPIMNLLRICIILTYATLENVFYLIVISNFMGINGACDVIWNIPSILSFSARALNQEYPSLYIYSCFELDNKLWFFSISMNNLIQKRKYNFIG